MSANGVIPFDPGLVTQSVNYHGHNLLKQLVSENASQIHTIKLQDIDYKVYQNRSTELRNLGGSRIQEIIGFIASKSDQLLVTQSKLPKLEENAESLDYEDRYKHQYPFEYFLNVNKVTRIQEFMNVVEVGDILYAEVVNSFENTSYTSLKFIAYDGGKHRYLTDIKATDLKLVLKNEDTFVSKADEDKIGRWMCGTRLRIEVLNINTTSTIPCLFVGTKGATLESTKREHIKLGKVQIKDLPQILSVTLDPSVKYLSDCIEKMNSFKNPQCIRKMASRSNIDLHWYPSLLNSVTNDIPLTETAKSLRKSQMCKWAHKNVADGVTYFKKGQHEEAFQCLSKALQIDPDNVEAFVAKGALLANLGRYEKAIEDFEKSLSSNPDHVNARKYMCETLVELGKQKEEKDQLKEAEKCYSRCLELNEHHAVAREALNDVSRKLGPESSLMKLIKLETMKNDTEYIADLIQIEQELNKKRNFEENPIPTITTTSKVEELRPITEVIQVEDDDDDENDENGQIEMEGALSPLSQKLANQQSLWTRPPSVSAVSMAPIQSYPTNNKMNMNFFSNPPPNWPVHALVSRPPPSRPPPMLTQPPKLPDAPNYDDQNYKARVEEFLKELETRSLGERTRRKSDSDGKDVRKITKRKDEKKEKKRRNRSSSSSGSSSSSDDSSRKRKKKKRSSSSSSDSSSSSSTSSDSSGSEKGKRKVSKKSKKLKTKKKKKTLKKKKEKETKEKEVEVEAAVPDFLDLEEKLMAYYKKMEAIQTSQDRSKSKSSSRGNSLEKKNKIKNSETKQMKKKKGENLDVSSSNNPLVNKLKLITHPAFLDDESEEEAAPKGAKLPKNSAPSRTQQENKFVKRKKTSISPSVKTRRSSPTSSSSRSSERDSRSRGRRSNSRSRKRSRSYSRERRSRSPSRRNRYRYSRSRSRSRSRPRYGAKYQDRSISKEKFGYYKNKPYFSSNQVPPIKNEQNKGDPTPMFHKAPPVQFEFKRKVDPKSIHVVEDAKKKIFQHLASNAKEFNTKMKPNEGRNEERSSTGSFAPSNRFGKWVNESNVKVDSSKTPVPEGSLAQFENFIKVAKEKNMELMKERNKAFLKPTER